MSSSDLLHVDTKPKTPPPTTPKKRYPPEMLEWIASDMDGTFFSADHTISNATARVYKALKERGVPVFPVTGRSVRGVQAVLAGMNPDSDILKHYEVFPGVYMNGAAVYGSGGLDDVLSASPIHPEGLSEFCRAVYQWFDESQQNETPAQRVPNLCVFFQTLDNGYVDINGEWFSWYITHWNDEICEEIGYRLTDPKFDATKFTILAVHAVIPDGFPQSLAAFLKQDVRFQEAAEKYQLQAIIPTPNLVSALVSTVNKGTGIQKLINCLGLSADNWVALGDAGNDTDMLALAPYSIVMGQAPDHVKALASEVAKPITEDGWAHALAKLVNLDI